MGGFGPHPDRSFPLLRSGEIRSIAGQLRSLPGPGATKTAVAVTPTPPTTISPASATTTLSGTPPGRTRSGWERSRPASPFRTGPADGPPVPWISPAGQRIPVGQHVARPPALRFSGLRRGGYPLLHPYGIEVASGVARETAFLSTSGSSGGPGTTAAPTSGTPCWNSMAAISGSNSGRSDTITGGWPGRCARKGCRRNSWRPPGRDGGPRAWKSCPPGNAGTANSSPHFSPGRYGMRMMKNKLFFEHLRDLFQGFSGTDCAGRARAGEKCGLARRFHTGGGAA